MITNREYLVEEQKEIKSRVSKLLDFISSAEFYKLSDNHKQLLRNQKKVMEEYLNILNLRMFENIDSFAIIDLEFKPIKFIRE